MVVSRLRMVSALLLVLVAALVAVLPTSAQAESNDSGSALHTTTTFFAYAEAGEFLNLAFPTIGGNTAVATVSVVRPDGTTARTCTSGAVEDTCATGGRVAVDQTGVWTVQYEIAPGLANRRHAWNITVFDAAVGGTATTGRVWTEQYNQYQSAASDQSYWVVTREGYRYALAMNGYNGIGSSFRANGFGLVQEGTCTPLYRSAEGTSTNANGVPLEDGVEYSGPECGDAYKIFLDAPAADLPATSTSARGTEWILSDVVPVTVENLSFMQVSASSRAGDITFDLGGVNGGYAVQIDTNGDGDFDDAVDRTIPWGSPPGAVSVPFDGLDGLGAPIGVCQDMNARVAVDRVGEVHFTLEDVEQLTGGIQLTGVTPGVDAAAPLLYWDDRTLTVQGRGSVTPVIDGRAGVDATVSGAHGWAGGTLPWGDIRAMENWSYYAASAGETVAVAAPCNPGLELAKDGVLDDTNDNGVADLGETVDYTFTATNTGNTALTGVTIDDPRITSGFTPATQDIPVLGQREFTASYVVTQADIDAGSLVNVATASGTDPLGGTVGSNEAREEIPTLDRDPSLTIEKSGALADTNANGLADVGESITYSFDVENTGNVTIDGVTVDDSRVTGLTPAPVTLAPGGTQTFSADPYVVTQADVNLGQVYNVATATGTSPLGPIESPPSEERIDTPDPDPGLEIIKTGSLTTDLNGNGLANAGDTVTYTFEVENIGNVDLVDVTVNDPRVPVVAPASQDVAAGQTVEFTGTLLVTQADVDGGVVRNSATASGTYPGPDGDVPVETPPSTFELDTEPPVPGLSIVKSGELTTDANGNGLADVGDTIVYAFLVENTGNTTLVNVQVEDPKLAAYGVLPGPITLAPGEDDSLTAAPYVVTQADVDAGVVANSATARGNVPNGPETTSPPDDFEIPTPEAAPDLEIEKTASLQDANGNGTADAGESVVYSFQVTNTGNVTLTDVSVVDERISGLVPESVDVLPPGVTAAFVAEPYVVTAEDVAAGELVNVATAVGTVVGGARWSPIRTR